MLSFSYNVSPGLEHHHGNWTSGKSVSNDQFGNNATMMSLIKGGFTDFQENSLETDLLVGDGLDHSDGNNVCECYNVIFSENIFRDNGSLSKHTDAKGQDKGPDWHFTWIIF